METLYDLTLKARSEWIRSGELRMKKLAIALVLLAAAPAVAMASSALMDEVTGGNEVVAETTPSGYSPMVSSKSSRPVLQKNVSSLMEPSMTGRITPNWL